GLARGGRAPSTAIVGNPCGGRGGRASPPELEWRFYEGRGLESRPERGRIRNPRRARLCRSTSRYGARPCVIPPSPIAQHPPKNRLAVELTRRRCAPASAVERGAIGLALTHSPLCKRWLWKPRGA